MGQEASSFVDEDTPPQTLDARSVEAVADFIIDAQVEKIVVMVGIPKARSKQDVEH